MTGPERNLLNALRNAECAAEWAGLAYSGRATLTEAVAQMARGFAGVKAARLAFEAAIAAREEARRVLRAEQVEACRASGLRVEPAVDEAPVRARRTA